MWSHVCWILPCGRRALLTLPKDAGNKALKVRSLLQDDASQVAYAGRQGTTSQGIRDASMTAVPAAASQSFRGDKCILNCRMCNGQFQRLLSEVVDCLYFLPCMVGLWQRTPTVETITSTGRHVMLTAGWKDCTVGFAKPHGNALGNFSAQPQQPTTLKQPASALPLLL